MQVHPESPGSHFEDSGRVCTPASGKGRCEEAGVCGGKDSLV